MTENEIASMPSWDIFGFQPDRVVAAARTLLGKA